MSKIKKTPVINTSKIFGMDSNFDYNKIIDVVDDSISPITEQINSSKNKEIFIDYFFITVVKLIETSCRSQIINFIDQEDLDIHELFHKDQFQISIKNIDEIRKKDFTKGRFIASNFNFQNLDEINHVFSTLLRIDIFESYKKYGKLERFKEIKKSLEVKDFSTTFNELDEFFNIRHKVIHSSKKINYKQYDKDFFHLWEIKCIFFIMYTAQCILWNQEIKSGNAPNKTQLDLFLFFKNEMKEYQKKRKSS